MTAFDALMPGAAGTSGGSTAGSRPGSSADWRQAVEQAQAKSWLQDRNLTPGQQGRPDAAQRGPDSSAQAGAPRPSQTGTPPGLQQGEASTESTSPAAFSPPTTATGPAVRGGTPTHMAPALPMAAVPVSRPAADAAQGSPALPAAAAGQGEILRAARARKQSIHAESGEQGVSVWIRDTSLNSRQASHLAAAIASALSSGRQDIASLYLNGRPIADGSELSSPNQSE